MAINSELKTVDCINIINVTAKNAVECRLNISEEEASSVIYSTARACIDYVKCLKNEIRYSGKVIFNFVTQSGGLKKCEAGVEFSYKTDVNGVEENDPISFSVLVENVKLSVVNGIPTASAAVVLNGKIERVLPFEYVKCIDGANCKKQDVYNATLITREDKEFNVEEEFDDACIIEDVISHAQNVKILSALSGIGAVVVSGELELNMVILQGDERVPVSKSRVIPFRFEQDLPKAMPDLVSICGLQLKDANLKIVVDKAKNKSTVFLSANLNLSTALYENSLISRTVDAYSISKELTFEKCSQKLLKLFGQRHVEFGSDNATTVKSDKNSRLIAPLFAKIEQTEVKVIENEICYQGVINACVLMHNDSGYYSESTIIPFESKEKTNSNTVKICEASVTNFTAIEKDDKLCFNYMINLLIEEKEVLSSPFIVKIQEGEDKVINDSAISVCIPRAGDSLWELSKSLGVCEEDIMKTNPELKFPLTGDERVVVYRELKSN